MKPCDVRNLHDKSFVEAVKRTLSLTDRQRLIFEYKYERGFMAAKTADLLCVSVDTIYAEQGAINRKLARIDISHCEQLAQSIRNNLVKN